MAPGSFRYGLLIFPLFLREFFGCASEILRKLSKDSRRISEEKAKQTRSHSEAIPEPDQERTAGLVA
jgi:hypothetical protein